MVTGGARGIGRGIAERMVGRGYAVLVTDVDGEAARRTAEEIGAAAGIEHDVRDPAAHRFVADHGAATTAGSPRGSTTPASATTGGSST